MTTKFYKYGRCVSPVIMREGLRKDLSAVIYEGTGKLTKPRAKKFGTETLIGNLPMSFTVITQKIASISLFKNKATKLHCQNIICNTYRVYIVAVVYIVYNINSVLVFFVFYYQLNRYKSPFVFLSSREIQLLIKAVSNKQSSGSKKWNECGYKNTKTWYSINKCNFFIINSRKTSTKTFYY